MEHAGKIFNTIGYIGEAEYSGTYKEEIEYCSVGYLGVAEYSGTCKEDKEYSWISRSG